MKAAFQSGRPHVSAVAKHAVSQPTVASALVQTLRGWDKESGPRGQAIRTLAKVIGTNRKYDSLSPTAQAAYRTLKSALGWNAPVSTHRNGRPVKVPQDVVGRNVQSLLNAIREAKQPLPSVLPAKVHQRAEPSPHYGSAFSRHR